MAQQVLNLPKIIANDVQRDGFGLKGREQFNGGSRTTGLSSP